MRLLKISARGTLSLTPDLIENVPPYAILSHTWAADGDEVIFDDFVAGRAKSVSGYVKLQFCADRAHKDRLEYFWIDTCCINRANQVELSEAITSMFQWYRDAVKCYVYLPDVSTQKRPNDMETRNTWESSFRNSRWFTRGWTLQELLAPKSVEFFSRESELLGSKEALDQQIHEITGIPIAALYGRPLSHYSVSERMRWAASRKTRRKEDKAYCLVGIFDVSMSLRYGEGEKAFARLQEKVNGLSKVELTSLLRQEKSARTEKQRDDTNDRLISWLAPARPTEIQAKVSASRHPNTGLSFTTGPLRSWLHTKSDHGSLMWITGKSGTGKTTLFSHVVETVQAFASAASATALAYHYCTFSDPSSQQLVNFLGSLVAQISTWQPSILDDMKEHFVRDTAKNRDKTIPVQELETALVKYFATFSTVVILVDALDESQDFTGFVSYIQYLLQQLPNLKVLVTSTISISTSELKPWPHLIELQMAPDIDIETVVESHLSENLVLSHLSSECKAKIRSVLIGKADRTFRWVALTLDNLCRQRTGKAVLKALERVPENLHKTYAAMLARIPSIDRSIAREVLLWLSFALRPMTLLELSEAAILEDSDTTLNQDSRLRRPEVILEICHGLIEYQARHVEVKLAHSSVKDYLLSEYARAEGDSFFNFNAELGNQMLMQRCLTYLMLDDFKSGVAHTQNDVDARFQAFPLLDYATNYWGVHASNDKASDWSLAEKFFSTKKLPRCGNYGAWVGTLIRDCDAEVIMSTDPLYYAASFGIVPMVRCLLSQSPEVDLERHGGRHGSTALQVACFREQRVVSEILVAAGADFWTVDEGSGEPAWFWAHVNGWTDLLDYMMRKRPEISKTLKQGMPPTWWAKSVQTLWSSANLARPFSGLGYDNEDE